MERETMFARYVNNIGTQSYNNCFTSWQVKASLEAQAVPQGWTGFLSGLNNDLAPGIEWVWEARRASTLTDSDSQQ